MDGLYGGWDWAPYTQTSQENANTFTKGIWKSVYVSSTNAVSISHLVPHVFYRGTYPIERMKDGEHDGFDVQVRVHVDVTKALDADEEINITISGSWNDESTVLTVRESGIYNTTLTAAAKDVKLWWPNGLGDHPLYKVIATTSSGISTSRNLGFRHFAIVTETRPIRELRLELHKSIGYERFWHALSSQRCFRVLKRCEHDSMKSLRDEVLRKHIVVSCTLRLMLVLTH